VLHIHGFIFWLFMLSLEHVFGCCEVRISLRRRARLAGVVTRPIGLFPAKFAKVSPYDFVSIPNVSIV
jgi:hypothetical protein